MWTDISFQCKYPIREECPKLFSKLITRGSICYLETPMLWMSDVNRIDLTLTHKFDRRLSFFIRSVYYYWPQSFSRSMERAERLWRHNDVIWQLVKLCVCQITSSWWQKCSVSGIPAVISVFLRTILTWNANYEALSHYYIITKHFEVLRGIWVFWGTVGIFQNVLWYFHWNFERNKASFKEILRYFSEQRRHV